MLRLKYTESDPVWLNTPSRMTRMPCALAAAQSFDEKPDRLGQYDGYQKSGQNKQDRMIHMKFHKIPPGKEYTHYSMVPKAKQEKCEKSCGICQCCFL